MITPEKIEWYQLKEQKNFFSGTVSSRVVGEIKIDGDVVVGKFLPEQTFYEAIDQAEVQNILQLTLNKYIGRFLSFGSNKEKEDFLSTHLIGIEEVKEEEPQQPQPVVQEPVQQEEPPPSENVPLPPEPEEYEFA